MTPLAQRLMGESTLPAHKRRVTISDEAGNFLPKSTANLSESKFFDLRRFFADVPLSERTFHIEKSFPRAVCREFYAMNDGESELAFWPAEVCWFEISNDMAFWCIAEPDPLPAAALRKGMTDSQDRLSIADGDYSYARVFLIAQERQRIVIDLIGIMLLSTDRASCRLIGIDETRTRLAQNYGFEMAEDMMGTMRAFVSLSLIGINSSRYAVSNVVVPGERDRQRSLRGKSLVGKFPLRAYSEITLRPGETPIPEPQHNATTGERAQHFVRGHLRRYKATGRTVLVRPHHRGNPALGMCQHRYKVEKP